MEFDNLPTKISRQFSVFGTENFICYRGNIRDIELKFYVIILLVFYQYISNISDTTKNSSINVIFLVIIVVKI